MSDDRVVTLVEDLERTLLDFIRKHHVTHDEYRAATDLIIAEVQAGEASLLFDVFFEAAATDVQNEGRAGSIEAIEGPFYVPGAPWLEGPPYRMPQRPDEEGVPLVFHGRVTTEDGTPLGDVEMDLWHADADGLYSQIHPGLPEWNLRGRFRSDDEGRYEVHTFAPPPYEIPKDGPTGRVLNALGRHFFRPAHLHVKLRHPYFGERTSQLYFEGGQYLETDVASAVRDELVIAAELVEDRDRIAHHGFTDTFVDARYDFAFTPSDAVSRA
ncbi:dioxygenase family protein [Streptomyces griseorubiginosus]|uniref:dioxygenase family protein n=1 Tax=Streptomyces griseorubiginosus TaxID=67304 RepID=UPI001AD7587C|nr:dioxygenase [Streptomyces griseorubiginosus]MBO4256206.1 catechol 1,2-dioxygenase [Streptomyces griseorubiginosus]